MCAIDIQITPLTNYHKKDVNDLIAEIAKEFSEPISSTSGIAPLIDNFWVATLEDIVIGTVGLIEIQNKKIILKYMFVKKEFRGKENGAASLLLNTAINWSLRSKASSLLLGTMTQFKAAQKFYEKNGFCRIPKDELPKDFPHNAMDDVFYQRILS